MTMLEVGSGVKWLGKMPSGITLFGLIGLAVVGIWDAAKLQDQVFAGVEIAKVLQIRIDAMEKLVDADSRRVDAISYRISASDDRVTALTGSITALSSELHAFKDQEEVFNRQLNTNVAEMRVLLKSRLEGKTEEHER